MVALGGVAVSYERGNPVLLLDDIRAPVVVQLRGLWRDWYVIAEQPAPAPHLAHPEGCDALRIVLITLLRVSRSCELFPDGFDLHLLRPSPIPGLSPKP